MWPLAENVTGSNQKPPSKTEAPQEPFKRAVAGCMRALAHMPQLEVAYAAEKPSLVRNGATAKARLTEPPRKLARRDAAILRGQADSLALRLACHHVDVHRRLSPRAPAARAVFEAVEQARVEAIGARRMLGVSQNLDAMLEERFQNARYAEIKERADAPLEQAVALIVRERLNGQKPPKNAQRFVDLWRPILEQRDGRELVHVAGTLEDQRGVALSVRRLLAALDMAENIGSDNAGDEEEQNEEA